MSEQTFSFETGAGLDDVLAPVRRAAEYTSTQLPFVPSMTRRVLGHVEANTLDIAEEALVIPADTFTSVERFAADQKMMRQVPHVVAWGGEIAEPGDYTTKDVMGTPVLLLRDSNGAARAFVNVCAHRGAQVAEGCGRATRFTCPYHAWSYDADGRLASLPGRRMFDGVDLSRLRLRPLPVDEQAGLIVVALDDSVSVDGFLDDAAADLADFGFEHYAHAQSVDCPCGRTGSWPSTSTSRATTSRSCTRTPSRRSSATTPSSTFSVHIAGGPSLFATSPNFAASLSRTGRSGSADQWSTGSSRVACWSNRRCPR